MGYVPPKIPLHPNCRCIIESRDYGSVKLSELTVRTRQLGRALRNFGKMGISTAEIVSNFSETLVNLKEKVDVNETDNEKPLRDIEL